MRLVTLLLPLFLMACSSNQEKSLSTETQFEENLVIGNDLKASRYSDIYFSGQPSMEDLKELKKQGFTHVVNLRSKKEYDEKEERDLIVSQGISYTIAPYRTNRPVSEKYLDYIVKRVGKHRSKGKTLIHCTSGNRVGAWAALHFFRDHKYSQEAALAIAQKIGLSNEKLIKQVTAYTSKKSEAPATDKNEEDNTDSE